MKPRKPQAGFTLIEIMIAFGLLGFLVLTLAAIFQYSAKATKSVSVGSDWISLKNTINQAIAQVSICEKICLRLGETYHLNVSEAENYDEAHAVLLPEIAYPVGPTLNVLAKSGTSTNGLVINSIKLWAAGPPETVGSGPFYNRYLVNLRIYAGRDAALQGGGQSMTFTPLSTSFRLFTGPFESEYAAMHSAEAHGITIMGCSE